MSTVTRSASASPCMALNGIIDASLFPLKSTSDVVNLFRRALTSSVEPDLTLLSIVVGYIELSLTTGEAAQAAQAAQATLGKKFPPPIYNTTNTNRVLGFLFNLLYTFYLFKSLIIL